MIKRFTFVFSARVTRDVEIPDGCEEGGDEYEQALDRAVDLIDVDRYAECDEVREARPGTPVTQ